MDLYELFADILDYPGPRLAASTENCAGRLARKLPKAEELLRNFQKSHAGVSLSQLQEAYTSIFDMQPECTLNLGYQLLGDDWRRSVFLFKLKELYQAHNFDIGCELPDHLCVLLRFLATRPEDREVSELLDDGLIPVLSRLASSLQLGETPYRWVLQALLSWLRANQSSRERACGNRELEPVTTTTLAREEQMS